MELAPRMKGPAGGQLSLCSPFDRRGGNGDGNHTARRSLGLWVSQKSGAGGSRLRELAGGAGTRGLHRAGGPRVLPGPHYPALPDMPLSSCSHPLHERTMTYIGVCKNRLFGTPVQINLR